MRRTDTVMFDRHHPLDVEIADLVDGVLEVESMERVQGHLEQCLLCRIKRQRLAGEPGTALTSLAEVDIPEFERLETLVVDGREAAAGELWLTDGPDGVIVLVRSVDDDEAVVVPVTFDVEMADDECEVLPATLSPLGVSVAIYRRLRVTIPLASLHRRVVPTRQVDLLDLSEIAYRGTPIEQAGDPRLEVRQWLTDRLTLLGEPRAASEAPEDDPFVGSSDQFQQMCDALGVLRSSAFVEPFRNLRVPDATERRWIGVGRIDELGVVVLAIDTPAGLTEQSDFLAAHTLLARCNGSALAVIASALSEHCEVFDAPGLFGATQVPAGIRAHRPQIAGLPLADAIAKFLDSKVRIPLGSSSGSRGSHVRVDDVLSRQVSAAVTSTVAVGAKAKIDPKRIGYASVGESADELTEALRNALRGSISPDEIANIAGEVEE